MTATAHAQTDTGHRHLSAGSRHGTTRTAALPARPRRAIAGLAGRQTRRSALVLVASGIAYMALEVVSYRTAYPNGVSPVQFQMFEDNPAVRMMQGVPVALDTPGGFAVWDGGWVIQLILALWAILTTTRLLRGEEDLERTDLLLAGPVRASTATTVVLSVLGALAVLFGAVIAVTMALSGTGLVGSVLLGLALAGVTATFVATAAITSQLVDVRRRAAALAAGVLAIAYVLRMVGNSTDVRSWVRWFTPLGWLDQLEPYGDPDLRALVPLVVVPILLAVAAMLLRARRDAGGALLSREAGRVAHLRYLGGPTAFAWRSNRAVLLGWSVGLGVFATVMGALIGTMIEWLAGDQSYQQLLASFGLDAALTTLGFLAMIGSMFGVAVGLQVAWRIGSARAEEESGRAEAILARPVSRLRWLAGHTALALAGALLLLAVSGGGVWLGVVASGASGITLLDAMKSVLNTLPVVLLIGGLTVACFGLLPRATTVVPVTLTAVLYVLSLLGPALNWPAWVLNLSPFTHLAWVPMAPWAATAGIVMSVIGIALLVIGLWAFHRRDLVGS
ncbi:ABC transporter permease [Longivirga aurantiaca]|uniref:ABC transporter permease n=1 Tax=Longivirga aurantiaca TaxID=1837743 RepID=A0ABW1T0F6_9ACTN